MRQGPACRAPGPDHRERRQGQDDDAAPEAQLVPREPPPLPENHLLWELPVWRRVIGSGLKPLPRLAQAAVLGPQLLQRLQ